MSAFKIKLKEGGLFMKIKLFYFIISCIFAILTSTNSRIDRVHSQFKEKEQPQIINGCLRIIEHTNLAYVEPHRVIIKDKLYLFFNEQDYFYIGSLDNKYPLSKFNENIV